MNRTLVGAAVVAAGIAALLYAMLSHGRVECEACVRFDGREACKRAAAADRDAAERAAIATACAIVAGGVTETLGCQGREPVSLTCREP
jgi:hypothetical protein